MKSYNNFLSRQIDFTFFINKKNIWHTCRPRKWTLKCGVCAILEWWNSKFSRYYYMSLAQEGERRNNSAQLTEFAVNLIGNSLKPKSWIEPKLWWTNFKLLRTQYYCPPKPKTKLPLTNTELMNPPKPSKSPELFRTPMNFDQTLFCVQYEYS